MLYEMNGLPLDNFGDTNAPWNHDKINIHEIVSRMHVGDQMSLVVYRGGKRFDITFNFELTDPYPTRYRYPGYDPVEYEIVAGMVVMQFAENHLPYLVAEYPYLIDYVRPENRIKPALIITHIVPGSVIQRSHTLRPGFIITHVNEQPVTAVDEFRDALLKSVETGHLALKTADKIMVVLPFKQILQDEELLARDFAYPISVLMRNLLLTLGGS